MKNLNISISNFSKFCFILDEVVTCEVFNNESTREKVMKKIREKKMINVHYTNVLETILTDEMKSQDVNNAALTCCLHRLNNSYLAEQNQLLEKEETNASLTDLRHGKQIFSDLLPCNIEVISSLFLPSDFIPSSRRTEYVLSLKIPMDNFVIDVSENVSVANSILGKVKKALLVIENTAANISSKSVETIYDALKAQISSDEETQMGLLKITNFLFPLSVLHHVIPESLTGQNTFIDNIGTSVMASLIEKDHLVVHSLIHELSAENFSIENINRQKVMVELLSENLKTSLLKFEMPSLKNYVAIEVGMKAVKNIAICKRYGSTVEKVFDYFSSQSVCKFDDITVQMPLLTVARRISNPVLVKTILADEVNKSLNIIPFLGFKVLLAVIEKLPYEVKNMEDYIFPSDLLQENINKERSAVSNCIKVVSQVENLQELVKLSDKELLNYQNDLKNAVVEVVLKLQLPLTMQGKNIYDESMKHDIFNNVQGQSCLYSLAEKLSSGLVVKQIITTESLKESKLPKNPGFIALAKVLEKVHVNQKDIQTVLEAELFDSDTVKKYLSMCQSTARIVKTSQE